MKRWKLVEVFIVLSITLMFVGCGGNGSSNLSQSITPQTISGVAAGGAPLTGTVYLKDSSNPSKDLFSSVATD